ISNRLESVVTYDLPDTYFNSYIERIQAITLEDINRVANRYLTPDRMAVVIVGDRKAIEESLRSLEGFNDRITFVDSEGRPATQTVGGGGGMK
ncbi:MAG TPA: hypothetical protein VEX60_08660, partial [Pyrinomonadaceae bacterium]|nr:hypothetical protein [Pyrinomonadaceae bacterium]